MSMKTDAQPAVWLGCLSCNNSGHLVGRWFPCDMIEEVTLAEVHGGQEYVYPGCEEVLALDSEYLHVASVRSRSRGRLPGVRSSSTSEVTAGRSFSPGTRTAHLPWTLTACRRPASSRRPIRAAGTRSVSSWSPGPTTAECSTSGRRTLSGTSTGTSTSATAGTTSPLSMPLAAVSSSSTTCRGGVSS